MDTRGPLIAYRRLDLEEEAMQLAVRAILAKHPKTVALMIFTPDDYDDEGLMEIAWRLHSWLSRQGERNASGS